MTLEIPLYKDSLLSRWDARLKIVSFSVLIFLSAAVRNIYPLIVLLLLNAILISLSRPSWKQIRKTFKAPLIFLAIMAPLLILSSGGNSLFSWGFITVYQKGLLLSGLITIKALCILTSFMCLFSTTPFKSSIHALHHLKLPHILCMIVLFTYRYIFLYLEELDKLLTAVRLRGFKLKNTGQNIKTIPGIIVTLLIRSYEQSERVYAAMKLRGFQGSHPVYDEFHAKWQDYLKSIGLLSVCVLVLFLEFV